MTIENVMNPNRKNEPADCFLEAGTPVAEIDPEMIQTGMQYVAVRNGSGQVIGAIRTERLRYILMRSREIPVVQILEHLPIGIIAIDEDSRIFYVNSAYSSILNVECGKIIGRYMKVIEKNAALLQVLKTREPRRIQKQLIETVHKYVSVNMFPLYRQGEFAGACSLFTDITELNVLNNEVRRMTEVAEAYNRQIQEQTLLQRYRVIGESPIYLQCVRRALMAAGADATVLIRGENGVGKEVICRIIQENSERRGKPFIKVNCAAIPEALMESELFGYEEGAFTGAKRGGKMGKFQLAQGGTLFLDEIGDLPLAMQAKLLRVLQEGEIEKVGGHEPMTVDVRIIAATNQPLEQMLTDGRFRMDLYYRLNVVAITIPPLRERGNDILLLSNEFLEVFNQKYGKGKSLSGEVYNLLMNYGWPGNVRELQNVIESAVILSAGEQIGPEDLPEKLRSGAGAEAAACPVKAADGAEAGVYGSLKEEVAAFERRVLTETLAQCGGSREKAMKMLKLSRRTFYRKLAELKMTDAEKE